MLNWLRSICLAFFLTATNAYILRKNYHPEKN
jgi:hypothetical protein